MNFDSIKDFQAKSTAIGVPKQNICLVRGENNTVFDAGGRAYIDFTGGGGENILGYSHPQLTQAIKQQVDKLACIGSSFYDEISDELAHELVENTVFDRVLFDNDRRATLGNAIKLITSYYDTKKLKKKILVVSDSINTITLGVPYKNCSSELNELLIFTPQNDFDSFRKKLTGDVGAVIFETFQIENGLSLTKHDFLLQAYAHSKSNGALLVMNEFIGGVGRTGQMFSYQYSGINPDIVLLSKGLGGGLPISALLARGELAYSIPKSYAQFSSSFLPSFAASRVVINQLKCGLLERVENIGNYFKAKLFKLSKYEFVREIRGSGLISGISLDSRVEVNNVASLAAKEGILISPIQKNTLLFLPPYTITRQEIDTAVDILSNIFSKTI